MWEHFASSVIEDYEMVNPKWLPFFVTGTSPNSWESEVPSNEVILTALTEQKERIIKAFEGKSEESIKEPIKMGVHTMSTFGDIVQFVVWHEGVHAGIIEGLNRTTSQ